MIRKIEIQNFRGQTKTVHLDRLNIISGKNGSGKSTIAHAIDFAIFGHYRGSDLAQTADAVFSAYSGPDDGELSVDLLSDSGAISRKLTKHRGKVSTDLALNGERIGARGGLEEKVGIDIFNIREFWRMSANQKTATLCKFAGVDPDRLRELDDKIAKANHEKLLKFDELKKTTAALKALRVDEQAASSAVEGVDLSRRDARLFELQAQAKTQSAEIEAAEKHNRQVIEQRDRAQKLAEEFARLSAEEVPRPELGDYDTEEIKAALAQFEALRHNHEAKIILKKKLADMGRPQAPTPPSVQESDIETLKKQIAEIEISGGIASKEDHAVFEVFRKVAADLKATSIPQEFKNMVVDILLEHGGPARERVKAAERNESIAGTKKAMLDSLRQKENLLENYKKELENYRLSMRVRENLELDAANIKTEWSAENERQEQEARQELAIRIMAKAKNDTYKADAKRRADRLEFLEKALGEMTDSMQERENIPALYEALKATIEEKATLEAEIRNHAKWQTLHDLAEKKHAEMKTIEDQAFAARDQEEGALSEKRELIATITGTIEERANKITAPATVSIQIGQDVRFFLDLPGGRRVPREGASGAEGVEFDVALSAALLDGEGVVIAEVAELDGERLPLLLQKIRSVPGNVQAIVIGHNLQRAPGIDDVDVNFLDMGKNEV